MMCTRKSRDDFMGTGAHGVMRQYTQHNPCRFARKSAQPSTHR